MAQIYLIQARSSLFVNLGCFVKRAIVKACRLKYSRNWKTVLLINVGFRLHKNILK